MNLENDKKRKVIKWTIIIFMIIFILLSLFFMKNKRLSYIKYITGSHIKVENVDDTEIERLNKLCKVWGFAKYYHPKVDSGKMNWDYELFEVLPDVIEAKDDKEVNEIIYNWINKLGRVEEKTYLDENDIALEASTDWIEDKEYLSEELSDLLINISKSYISERKEGYISFLADTFSDFSKEKGYSNMSYNDDGFKLLSLFRYWNIVEYYYPYKDIINEDWNLVLNEFIPKFIDSKDELSYKLIVSELSTRIHDSHASVYDDRYILHSYWGYYYAPINFAVVEDKIVITDVYKVDVTNIKNGDVVLKINGEDILKVIEEKSKYTSYSDDKKIVNGLSYRLFATKEDSMNLTIERDGKEIEEKVNCYRDKVGPNKESHKILEDNIGYINPGALEEGQISSVMEEFKDTDGVIIDLRYYPTDEIVYALGKYTMPEKAAFFKAGMINKSIPGEFIFTEDVEVGDTNPDYYKGKVIAIINETTQSNGEFSAMAISKAPRATLVGSNTIGADGNITTFTLPGGVTTVMTGLGIYYPDKSQTQRMGIKPDIYVEPTIEGIRDGRDELLEKAIEVIKIE